MSANFNYQKGLETLEGILYENHLKESVIIYIRFNDYFRNMLFLAINIGSIKYLLYN